MKPHPPTPGTLFLLLLVAGCTAEDPGTVQLDQFVKQDRYFIPDNPTRCSDASVPAAPRLNVYPNPTPYALQPFRGQCPGAAWVSARVGTSTANPTRVSSNGSFCIEVQLIPDAPNVVQFQCLDKNGCGSAELSASILHKSKVSADAGISQMTNLAKGQTVTVNASAISIKSGTANLITDGNVQTSVKVEFWDPELSTTCNKCAWFKIDLGKTYTISKLRVKWGPSAGSSYGVCYNMILSNITSPTGPDCATNSDWKTVVQESTGIANPKEHIISPVQARHAALLVYEDGGGDILGYEKFDIAEFEVWGQDPNATPPPPANRCK